MASQPDNNQEQDCFCDDEAAEEARRFTSRHRSPGHNDAAIHIYEKLGFEVEGRRRKAFKRDGEYIDSLTMALFLD